MISRRKLVAGTAGGIMLGLTGVMLTRGEASIRFIGRRQTIIALLDTSTERVLFVLGERDDELLANIPGLITVGKSRIDMVIATHRILASRAAREHLRVDIAPSLAIQSSESLPPIRGNVTSVTIPTSIEIGNDSSMHIELAGFEAEHPDFLVTIQCRGNRLVLASGASALRMSDGAETDLLVLPGSAKSLADANIVPQILVCNSREETSGFPQIEVFPTDPTIVRINEGSLSVRDDQFSS